MTRLLLAGTSLMAGACLEPMPEFVDPREALLVEWNCDAGRGERVVDDSGHGRDLELQGPVWADEGAPRLVFDGIDDVGVGPDFADVVPALDQITLEARIRVREASSDWTPRSVLSLPQSAATGNYGLGLTAYTAGRRLEFHAVIADEHVAISRDELYADDWVTVHGVYDGETVALYVDGEAPVDPWPVEGMLDAYDFAYGEQSLLVGRYVHADAWLAFELASIRIWGRGLPAAEVAHRHAQILAP